MHQAPEIEAPRGLQDRSKTACKDTLYVILELSLRRNKGQLGDEEYKSSS